MKKALRFLAVLVCANAIGTFAVTWQMDSSPFTFPSTGVTLTGPAVETATMLRSQQYTTGKVMMHYRLPVTATGVKLSIYNMNGACKASFNLKSSGGSVEWNGGKNKAAMGVYVAVLQSTLGEEKIKFSILQ